MANSKKTTENSEETERGVFGSPFINIDGVEYELILTTKATKEICDKYGGLEILSDIFQNGGSLGQMIIDSVWLAVLLANQSVLIHNFRNPQDKKDFLTGETVELFTKPYDIGEFKNAILAALTAGMKRDVEGGDDEKNKQGG